jgi:hypothetical protein
MMYGKLEHHAFTAEAEGFLGLKHGIQTCLPVRECFTPDVKSTPKDSFLGLFSTPNSTPNMMSICVAKIHPKMDYS